MTPDIASFIAGLAAGAIILWLARAETIRFLRAELQDARKAEQVATDRLLHAWKEGATIAPRPTETPPPPDPLPAVLQEEIDHWEDPEHRIMLEAQMREGIRRGKDTTRILLELDNLHP